MSLTHQQQQQIWDDEHKNPYVLKQMDSKDVSSGVLKFIEWLKRKQQLKGLKGIELGCGKGRNVIRLAQLGLIMTGIDFSPSAIKEAKKRAEESGVENATNFVIHDAILPWPFNSDSFDLAVDCFATTDIETQKGRQFATQELTRVLKPKGYLLAYLLSSQDEFHNEMLQKSPAGEKNAFLHLTTGKFEKTFDKDEILELYKDLTLVEEERISKKTEFFGKTYDCFHHWMVFEKK